MLKNTATFIKQAHNSFKCKGVAANMQHCTKQTVSPATFLRGARNKYSALIDTSTNVDSANSALFTLHETPV